MAKQLLVTSDDFGMCHSINAGIAQAMTQGIVRSTNFMVPCPWFTEAMALAKLHHLKVGAHLCVTCDWDRLRWGPVTHARSLMDHAGCLYPTYDALSDHADAGEIYDELKAQILRIQQMGHRPSHVDTHMMSSKSDAPIHRLVKDVTRRLCREFDLIYTYDTSAEGKLVHFVDEDCFSTRSHAETLALLESWRADGAYHLIGHAAVPSDELASVCSIDHPSRRWAQAYRISDLDFFLSPAIRSRIADMGFDLVDVDAIRAK